MTLDRRIGSLKSVESRAIQNVIQARRNNDGFPLLPWIVLIANKAGIFSWNFLPIYKLLNSFYIPFMQIFSEDGKIANFPLYGFAILFLLILIIPVSIYFGYDFGYRDIDLTMKIFYEKIINNELSHKH